MSKSEIIPVSEILEEPQSEKIGGWLYFFKILNILWFLLLPLSILSFALLGFIEPETEILSTENGLILFEIIPDFVFSFLILRWLKNQDVSSPNKIKLLIGWELLCKLLVVIVVNYSFEKGYASEGAYPFIFSLLYYSIWVQYFKRSKRVLAFYGSNAK